MSTSKSGIVTVASEHAFAETFERLESSVESMGLTMFALIDFSGDAEEAGLKMRPTHLLVFGNPRAGTPLMIATPSVALDLPLKILISEDESGKVWMSYNSPQYLKERHGVPDELLKNISGVAAIVESAAR